MISAYGGLGTTMTECRQRLWTQKTPKSYDTPTLCSLPPTTEAFIRDAKRAHFHVAQWYAALDSAPSPPLDPWDFGKEADDDINKSFSPTTVAEGVCVAPHYVFKLIRCGLSQKYHVRREKWVHRSPGPHVLQYFMSVVVGRHV